MATQILVDNTTPIDPKLSAWTWRGVGKPVHTPVSSFQLYTDTATNRVWLWTGTVWE